METNTHGYEKCAHCHLFVEPNDAYEPGLAEYVHLSRGDADDDALDDSHEAAPSGEVHMLMAWAAHGPVEMRSRFDTALYRTVTDLQALGIEPYKSRAPVTAFVEFMHERGSVGGLSENLHEFLAWLEEWERTPHGKIIMNAWLDKRMPTV